MTGQLSISPVACADRRPMLHPRLPLRAEPERLSASRPCLFGIAQLRHGARNRRPAAAAHRGYRHAALAAGIRDGDLRGSGLARHFLAAAGAAAERAFRRLRIGPRSSSTRRGCSIRVSRAAARSRRWSPSATATAAGRAIPTACRFIRAAPASCRRPSASAASTPASLMRCGSPSMRRWRRPAC